MITSGSHFRGHARLSVLALVASIAALVISVVGRIGAGGSETVDPVGAATPDAGAGALRARFEELKARIDALERRRGSSAAAPSAARNEDPAPDPTAVRKAVEPSGAAAGGGPTVAELAIRVSNLESALRSADASAARLADPNGIPAALAVLLASRGVVTKVGDIDAIRANAPVLAELVRDAAASDWQRLEAYRGLLMFPTGEPGDPTVGLARDATPDVASILSSSNDAKARWTAASWLGNCENPRVVAILAGAFGREPDQEVRHKIAQCLIHNLDAPGVRETLAAAVKTEPVEAIRADIERALSTARGR